MKRPAALLAIMLCLPAAMCQTTRGGFPDAKDVAAVTEAKPKPGADILTDPAADARYNSSVEGWGERLRAAGMRLCRFYERTGMPEVDCGK